MESFEQQLRMTNSLLMATIESTTDGLLVIDNEGREVLANKKFFDLWRIPEDLRKSRDDHLMLQFVLEQLAEPEKFVDRVQKIYKDTRNDYFDTLVFKDGRVFERFSRPQLIGNDVVGRVWSFRDVTQSRRNANEMMNALEKAEKASRVKGDFLANVSHEIRTPMTAILGYIDVVLEDERLKQDLKVVSSLETIRRNGEHLLSIINDILDLSKIEAGKIEVNQSQFSLIPTLDDVIELFQARAQSKGVALSLEAISPVPEFIESDLLRVRQILMNLIGNAIKFTEKGSIKVLLDYEASYSHGGTLSVTVQDTGIGIRQDDIQTLFKPFAQTDASTTRKFGGTGLGLTISKHLAQMLNGSIEVTSVFHEGSQFTLKIPLRFNELPNLTIYTSNQQRIQNHPTHHHDDCPSLAGLKLLLVEDGEDNRDLITHILQKSNAEVTAVSNGLEAIETIRFSPHFDVVIMDMQMPEMDGYTATRQLREMNYKGAIIALTAHSMSGDREKCIQAGCDDYASKPINRVELVKLCLEIAHRKITPIHRKTIPDLHTRSLN